MTNKTRHLLRTRNPLPLAVLPLLAMVLAFLSSVTHQHVAEARLNQGFFGPLGHVVVASHGDALRAQCGENEIDATPGDDRETPYWRKGDSSAFVAGWRVVAIALSPDADQLPPSQQFLTPLRRAPPLA